MKKNGVLAMLALIMMLTSSCGPMFDMPPARTDTPIFAQAAMDNTAICSGTYSNTIGGTPVTINLTPSTDSSTGVITLSGTLLYGSYTLGLGGFVDSSNNCFVWTWYNNHLDIGSGALAGKVTETTGSNGVTTATFDFGGGQGTTGIYGETILPNLQKTASAGTTTPPSATAATASYAGDYTGSFLGNTSTIILTQTNGASGTTLSGTLTLNQSNITLNVGGFVDANNNAFVWAWYNNFSNLGSGVVAGKLTTATSNGTTTGTFDFGGGQNTGGIFNQIVLSNFTNSGSSTPVSYAGTYSGTLTSYSGANLSATLSVTQTGSSLAITVSSPSFTTMNLSGTVSGNTVTMIIPSITGGNRCGGSTNVTASLSGTTLTINHTYPTINTATCFVPGGTVSGTFTKTA